MLMPPPSNNKYGGTQLSLPLVLEEGDNDAFEDVSISRRRATSTRDTMVSRKPSVTSQTSPGNFQVKVSRSSSISSGSSDRSHNSQEAYVVAVNKTPSNLTPSQRLKMRKSQISNSISQYKNEKNFATKSTQQVPYANNENTTPTLGKYLQMDDNDDDEEEEVVDDDIYMFNVPLSQSFLSMSSREKYTYTNNDRKMSLTNTDSTRNSSIMSHNSFTDTASVTSYEEEDFKNNTIYSPVATGANSTSSLNIEDLHLSKDAQKLTLLFNKNDTVQINEETAQRKRMLSNFKKINFSSPNMQNSSMNQSSVSPTTPDMRCASLPSFVHTQQNQNQLNSKKKLSIPIPSQNLKDSKPSSPSPLSSKSTSSYYSFTRPTWLPPKNDHDRIKHQKESEALIYNAILKESKTQSKRIADLNKLKKLSEKDALTWYDILPDGTKQSELRYQEKLKSKSVKEMIWRSIPENLRSRIWFDQIGNKLQLTENLCKYYFTKSQKIQRKYQDFEQLLNEKAMLTQSNQSNHSKTIRDKLNAVNKRINKIVGECPNILSIKKFFDRLKSNIRDTYPDLNRFQNFNMVQSLTIIITSFIIYFNETEQGIDIDEQHYGNLNFDYYFTGLNTLTSILLHHYKNSYKVFISLCNLFQTDTLSLILAYKVHCNGSTSKSRFTQEQKNVITRTLNDTFINQFEKDFKQNDDRLSVHFDILNLKPLEYVPTILSGIFSNLLDFQLSCHILDLFVFEGDHFLRTCLLSFLDKISYKLYGTKQENLNILGENCRDFLNRNADTTARPESYKYINVGIEHEFMNYVKTMHKIF